MAGRSVVLLVPLLLSISWGCVPEPPPLWELQAAPQECNDANAACVLPWPSSAFEVADPSSATGVRLELSDEADFATFWSHVSADEPDGASPNSPILAYSPLGLSGGFPASALASVAEGASIQLVRLPTSEGDSFERLPFLTEQVHSAEGSALLIVSPSRPLPFAAHIGVFVTRRVRDGRGEGLEPAASFAPFLASERPSDIGEARWDRAQSLLGFAEDELLLPREELAMVWDFHTRSSAQVAGDLLAMLRWADGDLEEPSTPPVVTVDAVEDGLRRVDVHFEVPLWRDGPHGRLLRDGEGAPMPVGTTEIRGIVLLPETEEEAQLLVFGHGLGAEASLMVPTLKALDLAAGPFAVALIDWDLHGQRGRGVQDVVAITGELEMRAFADALLQSIVDVRYLEHAVRGLDLPISEAGPLYLGQSLGAFLGVPIAGTWPAVRGAALSVGGGGISNVLRLGTVVETLGLRLGIEARAAADPPGDLPMDLAYTVLLVMSQLGLDPADPLSYAALARGVEGDRGSPVPMLLQESVGDGIVPNPTTDTLARALGLQLATPSVRSIDGLATLPSPACGGAGAALSVWDYSPDGFEAHLLLDDEGAQHQIIQWLRTVAAGGGATAELVFPGQSCP